MNENLEQLASEAEAQAHELAVMNARQLNEFLKDVESENDDD